MTWQCPTCTEVHADSFDACWNCCPSPDKEAAGSKVGSNAKKIQLSIRTLMAFTLSVGAVLAMFVNEPNAFTFLWVVPTYIACWLIPAASIGYDYDNTNDGIRKGLIRGVLLCILSIILMIACGPRVH